MCLPTALLGAYKTCAIHLLSRYHSSGSIALHLHLPSKDRERDRQRKMGPSGIWTAVLLLFSAACVTPRPNGPAPPQPPTVKDSVKNYYTNEVISQQQREFDECVKELVGFLSRAGGRQQMTACRSFGLER